MSKLTKYIHHVFDCSLQLIFSHAFSENPSQQQEYQTALDELKTAANTKKHADVRTSALQAIDIIENKDKTPINVKTNVCSITRLFYNDGFLATLEDIWNF